LQNYYQPYAWLVLFAIVPWWLEAVHGIRRAGRPPGHPVLLGAVGALLFLTYYYFFFIAAIALVLHLAVERLRRRWNGRQVARAAVTLAVAAVLSAVYWLPLAASVLAADQPRSLANRWFGASHLALPLPTDGDAVVTVVALLGLAYLGWSARSDALSRGLLVLLAAAFGWYVLGAAAAALDAPLLSFRGRPLVLLILLTAGVLGLVRLARLARATAGRYAAGRTAAGGVPGDAAARFRTGAADAQRAAWLVAALLLVYAGQEFVTSVRDDPLVTQAHSAALPDGSLPPHHAEDTAAPRLAAAELRAMVDAMAPVDNPVLLSDRVDLLVFYPYDAFLQWNAHYAHPAAEFPGRVAVLESLAAAPDPDAFATAVRDNPYGPIHVFVLRPDGGDLVYGYADDNFPDGIRAAEVRFPRELFDSAQFEVRDVGAHVLAVRR
jgi:galactan 5-O-arabinofuranosyltransferase